MYSDMSRHYEELNDEPRGNKLFEGKTITNIKPFKGLIAGQKKYYELWTQGSIITITDTKEVLRIDKVIKEAKKLNFDVYNYLQYMIDVEGILD